jgi:hypothetical protein
VVAFVEFLLCILTIYGLFRNLALFGASYLIWFVLGILSILIIFIAIALLLYAIKKENARFLIPHLSAQVRPHPPSISSIPRRFFSLAG